MGGPTTEFRTQNSDSKCVLFFLHDALGIALHFVFIKLVMLCAERKKNSETVNKRKRKERINEN